MPHRQHTIPVPQVSSHSPHDQSRSHSHPRTFALPCMHEQLAAMQGCLPLVEYLLSSFPTVQQQRDRWAPALSQHGPVLVTFGLNRCMRALSQTRSSWQGFVQRIREAGSSEVQILPLSCRYRNGQRAGSMVTKLGGVVGWQLRLLVAQPEDAGTAGVQTIAPDAVFKRLTSQARTAVPCLVWGVCSDTVSRLSPSSPIHLHTWCK